MKVSDFVNTTYKWDGKKYFQKVYPFHSQTPLIISGHDLLGMLTEARDLRSELDKFIEELSSFVNEETKEG